MIYVQKIGVHSWKSLAFVIATFLLIVLIPMISVKILGSSKLAGFPLVISIIILPFFLFLVFQIFVVRARISEEKLSVGGGMYLTRLPLPELLIDEAKIVKKRDFGGTLVLRVNGIGMPGLRLGWFTTRGGGKAFVAISEEEYVVILPTTRGHKLMISSKEPGKLLDKLKCPP